MIKKRKIEVQEGDVLDMLDNVISQIMELRKKKDDEEITLIELNDKLENVMFEIGLIITNIKRKKGKRVHTYSYSSG